jgi:hypothetical protein
MNKTKAVKFVLGIIFFSISVKFFMDYIDFNSSISESKPIVYSFVEKRINRGGRGESYDMIIEYKNRERTISINSKEYDLIEKGDFPKLFYSKNTDSIFSKWSIKLSFRITILFLLLSIVSIVPWNKLVKAKDPN